MSRLLQWPVLAALATLLLGSCTADTPLGTRGAPADERQPARPPSDALPTGLRLQALRATQIAPGHDFAAEGEALAARTGALGNEAWAEVRRGGVRLVPIDGSFSLGVHTTRIGRRGAADGVAAVTAARAEGQEAVLERAGVEERYLAGPLGLEQTFRIEQRPEGRGPLAIEVAFDGLTPELTREGASTVELLDERGTTRAVYRDLAAVDAEGRELAARIEARGRRVSLVVEDEGAAYPVVVDPLIVTQQAELTAADGAADEWFGFRGSVSGDTALVGAAYKTVGANTQQGAAYVFVRTGSTWAQQAELTAGDGAAGDAFGASVALSGDTAIVGACRKGFGASDLQGAVYVFTRAGSTWAQQAELTASDGAAGDIFGASMSLAGDTALIGAPGKAAGANSHPGAAYVFTRAGSTWAQQAELTAATGAGSLGGSVSLSGDTALVGAHATTVGANDNQGAAYVFVRTGSSWALEAELTASDGAAYDLLGHSVSLSGDTALVGAYRKTVGGNGWQGAAYVFTRAGSTWAEQAELTAADGAANDSFGTSVALSGNMALVGADSKNVGANAQQGAVYVFVGAGPSWAEQAKLTASDGAPYDSFGADVTLSGGAALVGAYSKTVDGSSYRGAAYVWLLKKADGAPCASPTECQSGSCADGVCCDSACGGGVCDACSIAAGAAADGTCALLSGIACDDGNASTTGDVCTAGICAGVDHCLGVTCTAQDECHDVGACDHATGACSNPAKADGSACSKGTCVGGACTGSSSSSSSSSSGSSGAGGSGAGGAGASSSSSSGGTADDAAGCGCRQAGGEGSTRSWLAALGVGLVLARRRRARQ
jgi:MYXO-CTERM domain-containing protein